MDTNDANFIYGLSGKQELIPTSLAGAVQIKNSTNKLVKITSTVELMPYSYALVSKNNANIDKLLSAKKIKVVPFSIDDSAVIDIAPDEEKPKKKKKSKSYKTTTLSRNPDAAVVELASIVSGEKQAVDIEEIEPEDTVQEITVEGTEGAPESNEESVYSD